MIIVQMMLHDLRTRQSEIENLRETIEQHRSALAPQSPRYDALRVQTTPDNRTEAAIIQLQSEKDRLERLEAFQSHDAELVRRNLANIGNRAYRDVIMLFYLTRKPSPYKGLTLPLKWSDVAARMGYSTSHCKRLHRQAVDALTLIFKA